jgi:hypothetical protein
MTHVTSNINEQLAMKADKSAVTNILGEYVVTRRNALHSKTARQYLEGAKFRISQPDHY